MQDIFAKNIQLYDLLRTKATDQRLTRYITACSGDSAKAIDLYYWNAQLSECFYLPLQCWEIALRNKLNLFMCWKYGLDWPFTDKGLSQLKKNEQDKVKVAIDRQYQKRGKANTSVGAVVADLSPGFWVALLSKRYAIPFRWKPFGNLHRIFPHEHRIPHSDVSEICNDILDLRNRIAHHEPVYHLPLDTRRKEIDRLLTAMCAGSHAFANVACRFDATWNSRPHK
jgi:hypothetical protein